jgi:exosortase
MVNEKPNTAQAPGVLRQEVTLFWRHMPDKGLFVLLLVAWAALFHFWGNATFGFIKTPSLFGWMHYVYSTSEDDSHGQFVPLAVLVLLFLKRKELMAIPLRIWWPALSILILAAVLHIGGFLVQQTRVSILAFFLGIYGLAGLSWGGTWMRATFFPMFLFVFCVPLGTMGDTLTLPLRLLATSITTAIAHWGMGINVIQDGTRIFNPSGAYEYEVAAACSGIRSLTVTFAIAVVYAFLTFPTWWKRLVIVSSAFPLAIAANVIRLMTIIVAAETFGQSAGSYVHESWWISLLPYIPAILGVLWLGRWLEGRKPKAAISGAKTA